MEVLTFDEFCANRGVCEVLQAADMSFIRAAGNTSAINLKRAQDRANKATLDTLNQRQELRIEYDALVAASEIRPPTQTERLIAAANGHPDNPGTQAARRLLDKKQIEWEITNEPTAS